jgi:hypothetical protein
MFADEPVQMPADTSGLASITNSAMWATFMAEPWGAWPAGAGPTALPSIAVLIFVAGWQPEKLIRPKS